MFDPCRPWKKLLTKQAEGEVEPEELALLEMHLRICPKCRLVLEADIALAIVSGIPTERMGLLQAKTFDEKVLAALNMTRRQTPVEILSYWVKERWLLADAQGKALEFKLLLVGGGLTASALVALLVIILFQSFTQPIKIISQRPESPVISHSKAQKEARSNRSHH